MFFPGIDGKFEISSPGSLLAGLKVEGSDYDSQPQQTVGVGGNSGQLIPPPNPNSLSTTVPAAHVQSSASLPFRFVTTHKRTSVVGQSSVTVKVLQANLSFTQNGKPVFDVFNQCFVELCESTANVPYILSVARGEFGQNHTLVTNDGLELRDSHGTQGMVSRDTEMFVNSYHLEYWAFY